MSQLSPRFAFAVCFCLLACLSAPAQSRWSLLGESPGSLVWYLDGNFIERKSGTVAAWQKLVLPDGASVVALIEWNCATRRKRLLQSVDYDPTGLTVRQQTTPLAWRFVIPGSIEETSYNIVCGDFAAKEANDERSGETKSTASFAVITKQSALLNAADPNGKVIRRVTVGEKLVLVSKQSTGIWYRILDPQTGSEGWLNGNHFKIVEAVEMTGKRKPVGKSKKNKSRKTQPNQ